MSRKMMSPLTRSILYRLLLLVACPAVVFAGAGTQPLARTFTAGYGQVEVGGRYAGAEFHGSRPLPSRISFYSPVANSIDLSTDYWHRGDSRPFSIGVRIGRGPKRWVGREPWTYTVRPHTVSFSRRDSTLDWSLTYEFLFQEPGMVVRLTARNRTSIPLALEIYTHVIATLRTCQSYARVDTAWTELEATGQALGFHFDTRAADSAVVFVGNAGDRPVDWTSSAASAGIAEDGSSSWIASDVPLDHRVMPRGKGGKPVAAFLYRKMLAPGDSLSVVQVLGSCRGESWPVVARRSVSAWKQETGEYDRLISEKAAGFPAVGTGDPWLDETAQWARGLIEANAHFLDGEVIPMPCPAEYNFFFTHDLLLTDLGAVHFDLKRVKRDLIYLQNHSHDGILPHAYYWRDDGFKTEYCTADNWNHLWFILVAAKYLRHSHDTATVSRLFPLVSKSLSQILQQKRLDGLMYAYRPDWWDIGRREGPRAYMTILAIRALRDFVFMSAFLGRETSRLVNYEALADEMQASLLMRLWNEQDGYLMSYNGPDKDNHVYMGSLLGVVYQSLPLPQMNRLVRTAAARLLDPKIGIRTVDPPDFHRDSVRAYFAFVGNEAGDPFMYANGGVWPHANAWFAQALAVTGQTREAVDFLRTTMSLEGVLRSPKGQPAFYEYRYADSTATDYGKVDKPSFLWYGGMYFAALYRLLGVQDNSWNLAIGDDDSAFAAAGWGLAFGRDHHFSVHREGQFLRSFTAGALQVPSCVLPLDIGGAGDWSATFGAVGDPYLRNANAIVHTVRYRGRTLTMEVSSFDGHRVTVEVAASSGPLEVLLDGQRAGPLVTRDKGKPGQVFAVSFKGSARKQILSITF